jgi:hypothetical protein
VISQILGFLSLFPWLVILVFSFIAINTGSGELFPEASLWLEWLWAYPLMPVGSMIAAWILFSLQKYKTAIVITSLPLLFIVPIVLLFLT